MSWPMQPLGELTVNHDGKRRPVKEADRRPGPYPYYGASGVVDYVDSYLIDGDYLLVAEDGENLRTRQTPIAFMARGKSWVNNHAHIVTGNDRADTRFLMYALQVADIGGYLTGAVMPKLTQANLNRISLPCPDLDVQRAIAGVLGTLDDKIELNRRMSQTLEAIAQAIFKSWFLDFDPVYAKASELAAEGLLAIGDGYRAKNDELGSVGTPFIRARELNNGFDTHGAERLRLDRLPYAKTKLSEVGDIAFTSKGTVGRFARVGEHTEPFVYSPQVCFWRSLRPEVIHPAVLFCWMRSDDLVSQIMGVAGQTDMAPYVSLRDQRAMNVPRFAPTQKEIGDQIAPILQLVSEKQAENHSLRAMRDSLLPRLLSGELVPT